MSDILARITACLKRLMGTDKPARRDVWLIDREGVCYLPVRRVVLRAKGVQ